MKDITLKNSSAQESFTIGTYETGLEHYLSQGKKILKSFAPFTKVYGYSKLNNVLREGDEIAFGYAG